MERRLWLSGLLLISSWGFAAPEADHSIHEELRGLLNGVEQAINSGNFARMAPLFTEPTKITTINQETISTREEIAPYFQRWFGPGGFLKSLHMSFNADQLTELYGDKTWGLVYGSGTEDYALSDGRRFPMKTRWTATVVKDTDGHWRIRAIHIGANFLDNPILDAAKSGAKRGALIAGAIGMLVGGVIGFLLKFRRS